MKKRLLPLILALAMVAAMLAGCGDTNNSDPNPGTTNQGTPNQGTTNQGAQGNEPVLPGNDELVNNDTENTNYILPELSFDIGQFNIDPTGHRGHGQVTYSVYEMLYTTESGIGSAMVPLLADATKGGNNSMGVMGMDHEDGSTEYLFYIYDYIYDSAKNHFTASDVVFSFEKCLASGQATGWGDIVGWEAVNDTTVKMTTTRDLDQKGELENILLRCAMFTEKAYNDSPSQFTADACGTGPYVVTAFETGAYVTCEARDDYWQTNEELRPRSSQANVAKFTAWGLQDDNTKAVSLQSGDIDLVATISTTAVGPFVNDPNYTIFSYRQNGIHYLDLNCSPDSIMSDPNMRLAIYYALNNEGLATILNAAGIEAYAPLTAFGHDLFSDYLTKWDSETNYVTEQNLELSKQYAEAAGYNGETLYFLNASDTTGIVESVQNMLINAGFKVELKSYDRNTTTTYLNDPTQWDLYYNMTNSSDYTTSLWSHVMDPKSFGGHTENFIDDEHYNELLSTALTVGSSDADLDAYWQYTIENAYFYPLLRGVNSMVLPAGVFDSVWLNDKNQFLPGACYYTAP